MRLLEMGMRVDVGRKRRPLLCEGGTCGDAGQEHQGEGGLSCSLHVICDSARPKYTPGTGGNCVENPASPDPTFSNFSAIQGTPRQIQFGATFRF